MKITRRQLRQIIQEALDPDLLKGAYVSSQEDREAFKDYIAKVKAKRKSLDFLHYETDAVYAELVDLLDDIASPGWIRSNLDDGLTKDQIIAKAQRGEARSREWMSMDSGSDDYSKTVGYTDPKGEKQMIQVNSLDDMNDIRDLLAAQDIPYSVD